MFTRDSSIRVGPRVVASSMGMPARRREASLVALAQRHHPELGVVAPTAPRDPSAVEGGDVLLLAPGVLAVGVGERTSPAGAESFARAMFADGLAHTVLAVPIAQRRATMHLDTVATMVDVDTMVIYPGVLDGLEAWTVRPDGTDRLDIRGPEPFRPAAARGDGDRRAAGGRHRARSPSRPSASSGTTATTPSRWRPAASSPTSATPRRTPGSRPPGSRC